MNTAQFIQIYKPHLHLPVMSGVIERRILVNFRCDPTTLARILPQPFRPKLVRGFGMAGVCLIRLGNVKPAFVPGQFGFKSENAAHRIAVEWDQDGKTCEGVFIPRRDTDSRVNRFAGGKVFPGVHHAANFRLWEMGGCLKLEMNSDDKLVFLRVRARVAAKLPTGSVFNSVEEASEFFQRGALGWSARATRNTFDGLELNCREWLMEPLEVECVESSFFRDQKIFPPGSAKFDSAFLMRDIAHEWHARGRLATKGATQ